MRIVVIGAIFSDSFAKCITYALKDMGHEVQSINPEKGLLSGRLPDRWRSQNFLKIANLEHYLFKVWPGLETTIWKKPLQDIKRFEPDLILSTMWDMPPQIVEDMKKTRGKAPLAVVWCPDAISNLGLQYVFTAPWDFLFFKDQFIVDYCRSIELNAHLLPLACYPRWHRQVELSPAERNYYGCDITIAGNLYGVRAKVFEEFLRYKVKIWGASPARTVKGPILQAHQHHYVGEIEKAKAFNAAAIVLNNMHYAEIQGLNKRAFEAAGCGAFQIISYLPVVEEYFVPGREIVVYRNLQELREIIPYYLNRPQERAEIAAAGYARAHAEHTYFHRLKVILSLIVENL